MPLDLSTFTTLLRKTLPFASDKRTVFWKENGSACLLCANREAKNISFALHRHISGDLLDLCHISFSASLLSAITSFTSVSPLTSLCILLLPTLGALLCKPASGFHRFLSGGLHIMCIFDGYRVRLHSVHHSPPLISFYLYPSFSTISSSGRLGRPHSFIPHCTGLP